MTFADITRHLEALAPLAYQADYDNAGLIVGNPTTQVSGVLVSLDCTEAVIEEAHAKGCNLVVAHHPIVFKGLKKLNGSNYVERTVIRAIQLGVGIYASHTNLDSVPNGVNWKISQKLGLQNVTVLSPQKNSLSHLVVFVPESHKNSVAEAMFSAGAGKIGQYDSCSFSASGTGTFRPLEGAKPYLGTLGQNEIVPEERLEVLLPSHLENRIIAAMKGVHPYETPAFYLTKLANSHPDVGSGAVGYLSAPMQAEEWLAHLKKSFSLKVVRHTQPTGRSIQKIAVCGGSGSFLLKDAVSVKADVFVTADYKYHEFFDADNALMICDIGHYESEIHTKELLSACLQEKFTTFATILSETPTNPVHYYF